MDRLADLQQLHASILADIQAIPDDEEYAADRQRLGEQADQVLKLVEVERQRLERAQVWARAADLVGQADLLLKSIENEQLEQAIALLQQAADLYQQADDPQTLAAVRRRILQVQQAMSRLGEVQGLLERAEHEMERLGEMQQAGPLDGRLLSNRLALALIFLGQARAILPASQVVAERIADARQQAVRLGWPDERVEAYLQAAGAGQRTPEQIEQALASDSEISQLGSRLDERLDALDAGLEQSSAQITQHIKQATRIPWPLWLALLIAIMGMLAFAVMWALPVPTPIGALIDSPTATVTMTLEATAPAPTETDVPTPTFTATMTATQEPQITDTEAPTLPPPPAEPTLVQVSGAISPVGINTNVYLAPSEQSEWVGVFLMNTYTPVQVLAVVASEDGTTWYRVCCVNNDKNRSPLAQPIEGYVKSGMVDTSSFFLTLTPIPEASAGHEAESEATGTVLGEVNVRREPNEAAERIGGFNPETPVRVLGYRINDINEKWYYVKGVDSAGVELSGFVRQEYLEIPEADQDKVTELPGNIPLTGTVTPEP